MNIKLLQKYVQVWHYENGKKNIELLEKYVKAWHYEKGKKKTSLNSKVVQEYERAVVFRLGRLPKGGDKGPGHKQSYCCVICACTKILKGLHFVLPCTEKLTAIDLRTQVFDVVPQEVNDLLFHRKIIFVNIALTLEKAVLVVTLAMTLPLQTY